MGKPHHNRWHQIIGTVIYGHLAPGGLRFPKTPRCFVWAGVWLAQPEVIKALHVENDGTHRYPGACAYGPRTAADLRPLYKIIAQKYKLMIFSGDTDACVPTVGTEEWTSGLGFPVKDGWHPWHAGTNQNATAHFITAGYGGQPQAPPAARVPVGACCLRLHLGQPSNMRESVEC